VSPFTMAHRAIAEKLATHTSKSIKDAAAARLV
jgi:hypothetical protein